MFNLQGSEIIVILLLALVVLGPEKLPDAIRRFTRAYAEFKKMSTGFQSELKSALDEPMREMRETATMVRDAADPARLAAEAEAEARLAADSADPPTAATPAPDGAPADPPDDPAASSAAEQPAPPRLDTDTPDSRPTR